MTETLTHGYLSALEGSSTMSISLIRLGTTPCPDVYQSCVLRMSMSNFYNITNARTLMSHRGEVRYAKGFTMGSYGNWSVCVCVCNIDACMTLQLNVALIRMLR